MDIPYDVPGPSDVCQVGDGDPVKLIPAGVPPLVGYHNGLLEIKATRDTGSWDKAADAYRWKPEVAA